MEPKEILNDKRVLLSSGLERSSGHEANLANSVASISARVGGSAPGLRLVWAMLLLRSALAFVFQAGFALGFLIAGNESPWRSAADWWLASFSMAEVVNLWLLARLARREGLRLRDVYNVRRQNRAGDLKWLALALVGAAPLGFLPNLLLARALWGGSELSAEFMFRPVPIWAAWVMVGVFPIIHALTELPTYFGYVMPRLHAITARPRMALLITAAVLSLQHVFLPLLFDWKYIVWRAFMFLPFALWLGWVIHRRPTALPYLAATHALLDVSLPILVLQASRAV